MAWIPVAAPNMVSVILWTKTQSKYVLLYIALVLEQCEAVSNWSDPKKLDRLNIIQ